MKQKYTVKTARMPYRLSAIGAAMLAGAVLVAAGAPATKDKSGFKDSQRVIAGAHFSAGPLYIYTEMRWGRNDPYTGDYTNGAATGGDDRWKKVFYANIGYYF